MRISCIRFVGPLSLSPCLASVWSSFSGFALGGRGASPQRLFIDDVACLDRRLDDAPCSSLLTPHSPLIMFCLGQRFGRLETVCFGGDFSSSSFSSSSSSPLCDFVAFFCPQEIKIRLTGTHTHTHWSGHQGVSCWVSTLCRFCCCLFLFFFTPFCDCASSVVFLALFSQSRADPF